MESGWMGFKDGARELMELQGLRTSHTVHFILIQVYMMTRSLHINLI